MLILGIGEKGWIHLCLDIDIAKSIVKYSLKGEDIKTLKHNNSTMKGFSKFDIIIGNQHMKYDGYISNLNVFQYDENVDMMTISANPCAYDGTYLSWKDLNFDLVGDVTVMHLSGNSVCGSKETDNFNLPLPSTMNFFEAYKLCQYFPGGSISELQNQEDLESLNLLDNYQRCYYYWTPYSGSIGNLKYTFKKLSVLRSRRRRAFQKCQ